jgi:hypothetical protein
MEFSFFRPSAGLQSYIDTLEVMRPNSRRKQVRIAIRSGSPDKLHFFPSDLGVLVRCQSGELVPLESGKVGTQSFSLRMDTGEFKPDGVPARAAQFQRPNFLEGDFGTALDNLRPSVGPAAPELAA